MRSAGGTAFTAKQARLKKEKEGNENCDDSNAAHCYDHTRNIGIGPVKVSDTWPATTGAAYNYADVLHKSFIFYFQQRSGKLPQQVCSPVPSPHCTSAPSLGRGCSGCSKPCHQLPWSAHAMHGAHHECMHGCTYPVDIQASTSQLQRTASHDAS